jgi:hypothetical protein
MNATLTIRHKVSASKNTRCVRSEWFPPSLQYLTAGAGFGLPMARIYASYFRGSLDMHNLPGTEAIVKSSCMHFIGK